MSELEKALVDLLRGTAIEHDEAELARLRKLPLHKQIEVGFVLRAAMLEDKASKADGTSELAKVRSVDEALRFLYPLADYLAHKSDPKDRLGHLQNWHLLRRARQDSNLRPAD